VARSARGLHPPVRLDTIAGMRSRAASKPSTSDRVRGALPWAMLLRVGVIVGERVRELSAKDRTRLATLLRQSRGWPANLGDRERRELRKLIGKLDIKGMTRELAPLVRGRGRKRR
jgi:hypothetical protein